MKKVFLVAAREFEATVATRGFIVGLLITPLLMAFLAIVMPRMMTKAPPKVSGEVAVIDASGRVGDLVRGQLAPEALAKRHEARRQRLQRVAAGSAAGVAGQTPQGQAALQQSLDAALGSVPQLRVAELDQSADLESAKGPLKRACGDRLADQGRLGLVVIHTDAVRPATPGAPFGTYDLYVREQLDDRIEDALHEGLREAIVEARVRDSGLDKGLVEALTRVDAVTSRTVTADGERETNEVANALVPAGFMVLLLVSVLTGGQYLLTSTVEEKSNRVVEVLLSAVSPMELMAGKILGQLCVGLLVLALYAALGLAALFSFSMLGLLDPKLIAFLIVFYLLAYLTLGSLMAAVGAAVNEMREAQTMMTPIMLLVMIPWLLWMPISRDPNSLLATVLSFVPPLGNFVLLLRLTSTAPPPAWQVAVGLLVSVAGAYGAVWVAAKVFRIGLLMFGKPPDFATLIRWVRMG